MKSEGQQAAKELYRRLRALSWERLWGDEVAEFHRADAAGRLERVAVIRAVGVVFPESGPQEMIDEVRDWLRGLLDDPEEKVRRYAMAALPKVGATPEDEARLIALLKGAGNEREVKFVAGALDKIGGGQTLAAARGFLPQTEQKALAAVVRTQSPGLIVTERGLENFSDLTIHLRGRRGLERIVREEVEAGRRFQVLDCREGLVAMRARAAFSLNDIFALRCFGTVGLVLGSVPPSTEAMAGLVASPRSRELLGKLTAGGIRYRIDFVGKGHQRGAVKALANRVYALCPEILNDPRAALWSLDIHSSGAAVTLEWRPRLSPDPRFAYRRADIPAASHPPLAACMARLGRAATDDSVWDPFCGSGVELIECALPGGVGRIFGTDLSPDALEAARSNFAAAALPARISSFACGDFRDLAPAAGSVSLIVTNPPLGMRVPVRDLRGLIGDLFEVAAKVLRPGGRLVFVNPLRIENPHPRLRLRSRHPVDMSGFEARLEVYVKPGAGRLGFDSGHAPGR